MLARQPCACVRLLASNAEELHLKIKLLFVSLAVESVTRGGRGIGVYDALQILAPPNLPGTKTIPFNFLGGRGGEGPSVLLSRACFSGCLGVALLLRSSLL